jgi:hypothetical protein
MAASWTIFVLTFLANERVNYNDALLLSFAWIAAFASVAAAVVVVRAWRGAVGPIAVLAASLMATAATLWLILLIVLSNH